MPPEQRDRMHHSASGVAIMLVCDISYTRALRASSYLYPATTPCSCDDVPARFLHGSAR